MPFYLRKSVNAGPFRFNFSGRGVGASVGVKGFRVGAGPRGHYVHAGRGGLYYRATIGRAGERRKRTHTFPARSFVPIETPETGVEMIEVESVDVLAMQDTSFAELLTEINAKRRQPNMAALLGWSLAALGPIVALATGPAALILSLLGFVGYGAGRWLDSYRRSCVLFYDLEPEVQQAYERAVRGFDGLAECAGKWHVEAGGAVRDITTWKRNAGATHIVRRSPTTLIYKLPTAVSSNVTPPALAVGRQVIYFLPDVALVDNGRNVGAISYPELSIAWQTSNFIEDGHVPRDAKIVGHTWKHPNKSGGPDRRFKDNRQLPVCLYEAMHLTSKSGLNELVEFSRTGMVASFVESLREISRKTTATPDNMLSASIL